jgi:hypothetical protein
MFCSHCKVMWRRLRWKNDYVDSEVENTIIEKLVMVYASTQSWHSLKTPRQAFKQYLIWDSNQEPPTYKSDCRNDSHYLCWGGGHCLQWLNVICSTWNVTNSTSVVRNMSSYQMLWINLIIKHRVSGWINI